VSKRDRVFVWCALVREFKYYGLPRKAKAIKKSCALCLGVRSQAAQVDEYLPPADLPKLKCHALVQPTPAVRQAV